MPLQPTLGLLPLYLKPYDDIMPEARQAYRPFLDEVVAGLTAGGARVVEAPVCRVESEFGAAVAELEAAGVDAIVTLHLAYSPSEESLGALRSTRLPVIMLDTTMDAGFGPDVEPGRLLYNHGVHGVMDLAALFRRWRRPFHIAAGHVSESGVLGRTVELGRAALAARRFRGLRTVRIGHAFKGMGDFVVAPELLASRFGIAVETATVEDLGPYAAAVTEAAVDEELRLDGERYEVECPEDVHRRSLRVGLGLRRFLEERGCGAFSMNFQAFVSGEPPVDTVPFLEASKAMARGIGYAGEGDVFTACLVGALSSAFGDATFTEIFCPDWRGDSLFLSHMGEVNPAVIPGRPLLLEKPYALSATRNPAFITGAPAPGPAVFVNLSPGPDDSLRLILAPVTMLADSTRPEFREHLRGWMRARLPVAAFLEAYSRAGGTHHCALVLGERLEALRAFGDHLGFEVQEIG